MTATADRNPVDGAGRAGRAIGVLHSVRSKLLLFSLLLIVVPGAILGIVALVNARHSLEDAISRQLREIAMDAAHLLKGTLSQERKNVRNWANQDLMRDIVVTDRDKRIARFLESVNAGDRQYLGLLCLDMGGAVVAASKGAVGANHSTERAYRLARAGKSAVVGPTFSAEFGQLVMQFASPIYHPDHPGEVIGVLLGAYDWQSSMRQLSSMRQTLGSIGLTVNVLVLNEEGVVIGSSGGASTEELLGENLREAGWQAAQENPPVGNSIMTEHRMRSLVGRVWLQEVRPRWSVIVMQPLREALAPVYGMQHQFVLVLVIVLVAALAVASLLATRLIRPLQELTSATEAFGRSGGLPQHVPVRTKDEIGRLAEAFNQMGNELKQAQEDLVLAAKFSFVGEVASQIAHEIRTPLSILRGSAQILERSIADKEARSPELISMIVAEVDRIDRVVSGLLQIARPRTPMVQPTPLAPLLERAVQFVAAQSQERRIKVEAHLVPDLVVCCDAEEIYQVALNLLLNAFQNSPDGGHITVRTLPERHGRIGFEVIDDGPGIPADIRGKIFTPFFTMREGGTGLGLAFVERVVQAHHGTVVVETEVGRGSVFRVELPAGRVEA